MATTRSFQTMLNEYLPNKLLREELLKRNWFLKNVEKDNSWEGSNIIVPFKAAGASSIGWGGLTAASDISEDQYVRGSITSYQEVWGSLIFNHRDLIDHEGKIPEATFLKVLPDTIDDFMDLMNEVVSIALTSGPHFSAALTDGQAGGTITVDKIDRFALGQRVTLDDDNSAQADYYVIALNVNTDTVTLSATRGGAAADISAYTAAQNAKFYHPGVLTAGTATTFNSLRSTLLSAANGGDTNIHGVAKTSAPFLQAVNVSGATISASNILDKIFDAYVTVRSKAKGRADTILLSFKHMGSILKLIEAAKGPYNVVPNSQKVSEYGYMEIMIGNVAGSMLKIVAIQEMLNTEIFFLDMKSMVFRSKGFFRKRKGPNGNEWFEVRNTTGFQYIVDTCLFGELEVSKPGHNGVIYAVANY